MAPPGIEVVYKTVGDLTLTLRLFLPTTLPSAPRPALLFFHGGGFIGGHPAQFFQHCMHYAARGLVAMSARYRLLNKGAASITECLADAKSAIRWLRAHAAELQVDASTIVVGGSSGGALLAADAAMIADWDDPDDTVGLSARPDALVMFSPALFESELYPGHVDPALFATNHVQPNLPPMLILHGADDSHFPLTTMQDFRDAVVAAGNVCTLRVYPGDHSFANYERDEHRPYQTTLADVDRFLVELGVLQDAQPV